MAPYAELNIHAGTEPAVPARASEKLCFSHPHYSDMLTKSKKAKKQEGDSKVGVCPGVHHKLPDTEK